MPKRLKQRKRSKSVREVSRRKVEDSIREYDGILPPSKEQISQFMAVMGRKGGKIGGKRRLQTMTSTARSELARRAAEARWRNH
jgi:hypothetical protein